MLSSQASIIPFTAAAYQQLQADFERLTTEEKAVIVRLQTAREMGDLSENGAYHAAKFELGSVRRQLSRLKYLIENGQVVEKKSGQTIGFGSTVTVTHQDKPLTFTLVSKHESDPSQQKLSIESPLGQALLGQNIGSSVMVTTPQGDKEYQILNVT